MARANNQRICAKVSDGSMFLKTEMRNIILDRPVGIQITRKLQGEPVLIQIACRSLSFLFFLFHFLFTDGMAGRLNQTGINGYALVDG